MGSVIQSTVFIIPATHGEVYNEGREWLPTQNALAFTLPSSSLFFSSSRLLSSQQSKYRPLLASGGTKSQEQRPSVQQSGSGQMLRFFPPYLKSVLKSFEILVHSNPCIYLCISLSVCPSISTESKLISVSILRSLRNRMHSHCLCPYLSVCVYQSIEPPIISVHSCLSTCLSVQSSSYSLPKLVNYLYILSLSLCLPALNF